MEFNQYAIHEAAHAVIAWLQGGILSEVTICGPVKIESDHTTSPYYCRVHGLPGLLASAPTAEQIQSIFLTGLAGYEAERLFFGTPDDGAFNEGFKLMLSLAPGALDPGIKEIADDARRLLEEFPDDWKTAVRLFVEEYGHAARDAINDEVINKAIEALAQELAAKGRLSGYDAALFLEHTWPGDIPSSVVPAEKHGKILAGVSLANSFAAADNLLKMAADILREYNSKNDQEEAVMDRAVKAVLTARFIINDLEQGEVISA